LSKLSHSVIFNGPHFTVVNKASKIHFNEVIQELEPVHRLDFETSGCLVLAPPQSVKALRDLFQAVGSVEKIYWAGIIRSREFALSDRWATHSGFIGSRYRSSKKVIFHSDRGRFKGFHSVQESSLKIRSLNNRDHHMTGQPAEVQLITGARHQIRATLTAFGSPLVGDPVYNLTTKPGERLELHARSLRFTDPFDGTEKFFEAPWVD
jgi:23S rRNA-/tRNA-specific pseudouridylate synthase